MDGVKSGDREKGERLCDLTYNYLYAYALRYTNNRQYARDVLHEAYARVFTYISAFDCSMDGFNWLCKIVQNAAYDFNKKYENERTLPIEYADGELAFFLDDVIAARDISARLMDRVDKRDREYIADYFFSGKSYKQIAAERGSKRSTVHSRIKKAVRAMLKTIKSDEKKNGG